MMLPKREDAFHKAIMYRVLTHVLDDKELSGKIYFKGGTCAVMMGYLDRFSVDLDFDLTDIEYKKEARKNLKAIFSTLKLQLKSEAKDSLFFVLKYESRYPGNTLKFSVVEQKVKSNLHKPYFLPDIDRYALCQTIESMFANKLVAPLDRYEKYQSIAGRDLYDIHHFFLQGLNYRKEVIEERRKVKTAVYLKTLLEFIKEKINDKVISQDLNHLLNREQFQVVRKTLKQETIVFLEREIGE